MIYVQLNVFSGYAAYATAADEASFLDLFRSIVHNAVAQYEDTFGEIAAERKKLIQSDMSSLALLPGQHLGELTYDMKIDGAGYKGTVEVNEIFSSMDALMERYQPLVDELNIDVDEEEDKWSVIGGFFPATLGYEIDELFK